MEFHYKGLILPRPFCFLLYMLTKSKGWRLQQWSALLIFGAVGLHVDSDQWATKLQCSYSQPHGQHSTLMLSLSLQRASLAVVPWKAWWMTSLRMPGMTAPYTESVQSGFWKTKRMKTKVKRYGGGHSSTMDCGALRGFSLCLYSTFSILPFNI